MAGTSGIPSTALRLTQIAFGVFFCLTCAGVIFGFAALKPVLTQEGVYADYCKEGERQFDSATGRWSLCEGQDIKLNFMFTLSAGVTNIACLPIGYTLDKLGPRRTSLFGAVLFLLGNFFFGLHYRSAWMDTYVVGFLLLALGGPLIFLPSFHLSNAFPAYSGLILSGMTGAFDASSIPYVVYRAIYDNVKGGIPLRTFFWFYMIIPFIVIIEQATIGPPVIYQRQQAISLPTDAEQPAPFLVPDSAEPSRPPSTLGENLQESSFAISASAFSRVHLGDDLPPVEVSEGKETLNGTLYGLSASQQIKSLWFLCLTLFVCIHMARINFYILSVSSQLQHFTQSAQLADSLSKAFTLLLPIVGFLGIPLIGYLLDNRPWIEVPTILLIMGLFFGLLGMSKTIVGQLIGIGIFCLFRPLMYTAISDAFVKAFGFEHFGSVYGLCMTTSGIVGLLNAPLDVFIKTKLNDRFESVDLAFVALGVFSAGWFAWKVRGATRSLEGLNTI